MTPEEAIQIIRRQLPDWCSLEEAQAFRVLVKKVYGKRERRTTDKDKMFGRRCTDKRKTVNE